MTSTMSSEYSTADHVILSADETSEFIVYSIVKKLLSYLTEHCFRVFYKRASSETACTLSH